MDEAVSRYYELKRAHKEIERELAELRTAILAECGEESSSDRTVGDYRVKIVLQERREYDDDKLYAALPDPQVWRLMSRADPARIAALIELDVLSDQAVREACTVKKVPLLQVERR